MADNMAPPVHQDVSPLPSPSAPSPRPLTANSSPSTQATATSSSVAANTFTSTPSTSSSANAFPANAANHGYTSAQYVSKHRPVASYIQSPTAATAHTPTSPRTYIVPTAAGGIPGTSSTPPGFVAPPPPPPPVSGGPLPSSAPRPPPTLSMTNSNPHLHHPVSPHPYQQHGQQQHPHHPHPLHPPPQPSHPPASMNPRMPPPASRMDPGRANSLTLMSSSHYGDDRHSIMAPPGHGYGAQNGPPYIRPNPRMSSIGPPRPGSGPASGRTYSLGGGPPPTRPLVPGHGPVPAGYNSPSVRSPVNGPGYSPELPRGPPPPYSMQSAGHGSGPAMGPPRPMRPPGAAAPPPNPRYSTISLHDEYGPPSPGAGAAPGYGGTPRPPIRPPPPSTWHDAEGVMGQANHRRTGSMQAPYYGPGEQVLDRQHSTAARYGPAHPHGHGHGHVRPSQPGAPYPSPYNSGPMGPGGPNRHLIRHQLSDMSNSPSGSRDSYYGSGNGSSTFKRLSISESLDGGRLSIDSSLSTDSYSTLPRYPHPAAQYEQDSSLDNFPPTRQRSASKSSVGTAHSIQSISDYYADFDSMAMARSSTPNGTPTPQIAIQSAQGYAPRSSSYVMRARTPSPGRSRQGSNPTHMGNPPVFLATNLPQTDATRRSAESVRVPPTQAKISRLQGERSQSFSAYGPPQIDIKARQMAAAAAAAGGTSPHSGQLVRKSPVVYPALLSRVAEAFVQRIVTSPRIKDSIEYKDCFDGRDAVEKIAFIIKTTDRNLALLLGRALDAQKLFHDVTYDHRLRDSVNELYQFRNKMITGGSRFPLSQGEEDGTYVNGVFTLLTDCYSPTCTRDRLCYSIACPRRIEQQSRLNLTPNGGLKRNLSRSTSKDKKDQRLWITSVPKDISDSLSNEEKKRQEVIFELIYTEKDFVNDLKYLNDFWIKPLRTLDIIEESYREIFINQVFYNINDVYAVNSKLGEALLKRQQAYHVIPHVGDIFLEHVVNFSPFVQYGANQIQAKYETERRPESRKLELNGYLTKPTTRLGRYPLLLEAVLKYTPDDNPDKKKIPEVISIIKDFLQKVNLESGKCENLFNLRQINERLTWKNDPMDLNLLAPERQLIMKGPLKKKGSSSEHSDIYVFVFDHVLLLTKEKKWKGGETYKVHKRPIPLELLTLSTTEEPVSKTSKRSSSLIPYKTPSHASNVVSKIAPVTNTLSKMAPDSKSGFPIVFHHMGRNGGSFTLYATTQIGRQNWMDKIQKQIMDLKAKADSWRLLPVSEKFFPVSNKVHSSSLFDNGQRLVIGTDTGVYVGRSRGEFVRVIARERVSQVDVLEDERILLVLADKTLYAYGLETLDLNDPNAANKRARKLGSHVSFFKTGVNRDKTLVGIVKNSTNALDSNSTIKTLEPIEQAGSKKNKPSFRTFMRGGNSEMFKTYVDFYIPRETHSLHFLRNILCVGCSRGFELVDPSTLKTQDLLDPTDPSLDFVLKKGENVKPIAIYRIENDSYMFLLCYEEFAFYVDKRGRRRRNGFIIYWEGVPTFCALSLPYVIAFDPNFIEIRHVDTGDLVQIIPGNNIRCLYHVANTPGGIHIVMTDEDGEFQSIAKLCRESQVAELMEKEENDSSYFYDNNTILEEDEDQLTPSREKSIQLGEDDEVTLRGDSGGGDRDGEDSPIDETGSISSGHPNALSRPLKRLTLDLGEPLDDIGIMTPDSPQSVQEILDIRSGFGRDHNDSTTSLTLRESNQSLQDAMSGGGEDNDDYDPAYDGKEPLEYEHGYL
ncbi:RHO1 GDP-GTP exchange protein 2 [Actinomortierella wolfii]|nr:RHO1 GDP-GTP exchange protein 2 [Actinomortierella wolfii]